MATISPTRPSRRAAARKHVITEDSDDEDELATRPAAHDEDEEDFTPAPAKSPRRQSRRKNTEVPSTPRTAQRARKTMAANALEPAEIFEPGENVQSTPTSPTKQASPRKRNSVVSPKKSRVPAAPKLPSLPSPPPSVTPETSMLHSTPLADITQTAVNEQLGAIERKSEIPKISSSIDLETPMEIVVRTRALGIRKEPEPSGPRSRPVIKYLVLKNFKSYAGRQEIGPFHPSFSAVVGPNGSGKSNVIDSLLFVFGFRASKMRQGKISALIHNSAAFPDLDHCEVEIHFQEIRDLPAGAHEVVPNSTLVISRKAFKNNSSKYYINSRESNFTTVTTLLKDKGVDLDHKRFLILQGEVESIAQMKPKAANDHDDGLLEYLEDIIGTSKYKTPIEESAAEVETLNEVCAEKNSRVQHVEKEKNNLEDKKNLALAYIRNENELTYKQSALYQIYIDECNDNLKITEEAVEQIQAKLDEELGRHKGNEDDIKSLEKGYRRGEKEYESLEKETLTIAKDMAKFDKESVKLEEKKKFLINKQKKVEKAARTSKLARSEVASMIEKYGDDVERSSSEILTLEKNMKRESSELESIRASLKGKTQAISDEIARKQQALEPWNEKINQKESAIAVARSELDIISERASSGKVALDEAQAKIQTIEEIRQQRMAELDQLKQEKAQAEQNLATMQQDLAKHVGLEAELRNRLSSSRQRADDARASLAKAQSQGNVLNGLMRLKDSGRIEGFHGRLGNLGTIDQKYDVAISTACPSLENLVVDSVDAGQQCIEYLRKNNLGRANIILLDRLAKRDMSTMETPEGVPRLFDLVKAKEVKFLAAFYSVLQNTLVAKDLEQANRIAYGARRWRVVTLDGQLIDVSGTMSGGGTRVAKGGMSSKLVAEVTPEQASKLENERDTLETKYQEFQRKQRDLESDVKDLTARVPSLETRIQKSILEVESSSRNIADVQRRIAELSVQQKPAKADEGKMASLTKKIGQLETELESIHDQSAGLEQEIKALQDKIMEIGGVRLRAQKAKVDGLRSQIDNLTEETSNAEVSRSKARKDQDKHEKACSQSKKDMVILLEELEHLEGEVGKQVAEASGTKAKIDAAEDVLDAKKEQLEVIKQELEEKTAKLNETRAAEIEMKNKLDENHKALSENQKQLRYWADKLGKLALQPVHDLVGDQTADELPEYTKDELQDMSKHVLKTEIAVLEEASQNTNIDLGVLDEYRKRVEEHAARSGDLQTALSSRDGVKRRCDELRKLRLEGFMEGFSIIALRLKEMYQLITLGGNCDLELVDSLDPFSEGILFSVMPPKKSWKNISNLSGGEKTLSSLALVFALHSYKPTPWYFMDEIDAALDFRNVSIIAGYIKERTKQAQFIVISLRNNMFELASRLVGIYKVNHMTKSVTIENREYMNNS